MSNEVFSYEVEIDRKLYEGILGNLTDEQWGLWCAVMHEKFEAVGVLSDIHGTPIWEVLGLGTDNAVSQNTLEVKA